jgi:hypothetical protein
MSPEKIEQQVNELKQVVVAMAQIYPAPVVDFGGGEIHCQRCGDSWFRGQKHSLNGCPIGVIANFANKGDNQ